MPDPLDALSDLLVAASRARDLADAVSEVAARAEVLVVETNWHARAAWSFRAAIRAWGTELVDIRLQLEDLAEEAGAAAAVARHRLDVGTVGVLP